MCSHSPNDVPPEPQRNVSIAAVRGAVRPCKFQVSRSKPTVNEIESELRCLVTAFVKPVILSGDYFCLGSYISSDGHFYVVDRLVLLFCDSS